MRSRIVPALLLCAGLSLLLFIAGNVHAQAGDEALVATLSSTGHEEAHSVAFSPDGKQLAVGGTSGVYLFHTSQLSSAGFIETGAWARSLAFIPGSNTLAAGLFDSSIKLWSMPEAQMVRSIDGPAQWVWSISVSRDGSLIASGWGDEALRVFRTADGSPVMTIDQGATGVRAVAISPDGSLVAAGLGDNTVRVWRVADGSMVHTLSGHEDWVRGVAFSPDGKLIASAAFDRTVRIWDAASGQLVHTLTGATTSVLSVAFSPDGSMVASGSENDARLWRVTDGALLQVLQGHADFGFVYAVAFSPDGSSLATAAADNTVRLWDLKKLLAEPLVKAPSGTEEEHIETPDCRQCHHPRGQALPPRITVLRCEGCHAGGANLEWCPGLGRAADATMPPLRYTTYQGKAGVAAGGDGIAVVIASPSNGETLYAKHGIAAPAVVAGQVYSGKDPAQQMQVQLEVWSGGQQSATLTTTLSENGQFKFNLGINPQGAIPYIAKPNASDCLPCHEDYRPQAEMPAGEVRLRVTISTANGDQASDERWIHVDTSGQAALPITVLDSATNKPLSGILVDAATVLYGWRDRFGHGTTAAGGNTQIDLEALAQGTTSYSLSIRRQVVDGVLYTAQPVQVQFAPGTSNPAGVTLHVTGQQGQVTGALEGASASNGLKVWAVQLPAGPAFEAPVIADNTFTFDPIPVSRYALSADVPQLAAQGLAAQSQSIDLSETPATTAALRATQARVLSGHITAQDGTAIPFAWITVNGKGPAQPLDATAGSYILAPLAADASFVTVSAPGYYAETRHIEPAQMSLDVQLTAMPETKTVAWGSGRIVVTGQTPATVDGNNIELTRGWLWGEGGGTRPLTISLTGVQISIPAGRFALEQMPGELGWLYLYAGKAQVTFDGQAPLDLQAGDMLALDAAARPFPMGQTAFLALHASSAESPVGERIQPTFGARLANWLEKAGVGVAQSITFITYIISLVALFTIPLIGVFWFIKRRNRANPQEKH